jgi:tripartite-type tricarboxylate transporter receptor subunit TctC
MKLARRRFLFLATIFAPLPTVFLRTAEAQTYPTRTVRVIVPLSAGSGADILARQLAAKLSESWSQPVVVENRPGAGTTVGTEAVAKAPADGHTLLVNSAAFAASAAIYSRLGYDPSKDLAPVSQVALAPIVVVAAPSLGAKSIKDLIELAKAKPGQLNFGSAGVGSSTHFAGAQFNLAAGLNAVHVPYKGPPEALLDTLTGRIQYSLSPILPALPHIKDGKLLALAVTTAQRSPLLPDVPTATEAGVSGYEYQDWWGVFAPAATPFAVIAKISEDIGRVLGHSDVRKQLLEQGAEARSSTPNDFTKFVGTKIEQARLVAASANIRAD